MPFVRLVVDTQMTMQHMMRTKMGPTRIIEMITNVHLCDVGVGVEGNFIEKFKKDKTIATL